MNRPLGKRQLEALMTLCSPSLVQVVPDKITESLMRRGLAASRGGSTGGFVGITPAGLRAAADAFEAGEFDQFFEGPLRELLAGKPK